MSALSDNLRYFRKQAGLTQQQLADQVQIKRSRLGAYEEARAVPPPELLQRLAEALGVAPERLETSVGSPSAAAARRKPLATPALSPPRTEAAPAAASPTSPASPLACAWVTAAQAKTYALRCADPTYLAELPRLHLPLPKTPEQAHRAFEVNGQTVVATLVRNWYALRAGEPHVVVARDGLHYGSVGNELADASRLVVDGQSLPAAALVEIWAAAWVMTPAGGTEKPPAELTRLVLQLQREVAELKRRLPVG